MSKVVNIHKRKGIRPYFDVYIGRRVYYTEFQKNSIWYNPFTLKRWGDLSLKLYETYLRNSPELLNRLPELKGKILGCWCKNQGNGKCHGDILIKLLKEQSDKD